MEPTTLRIPRASYHVGILHGSGPVGGELIRLLLGHPSIKLARVTSRTLDGQPLWAAHPTLRGQTDLHFSTTWEDLDAIFCTAVHGRAAHTVADLIDQGFDGPLIDLSPDFRAKSDVVYPAWHRYHHPAPDLLPSFHYGLPEITGPYPDTARFIANPGAFATGLALALWPLARHLDTVDAAATAMIGTAGTEAANVHHNETFNTFEVLQHPEVPEAIAVLGEHVRIALVPCVAPWSRGLWGTIHVALPKGLAWRDVNDWFETAYADVPSVRCWPGSLPDIHYTVHTPFCDLGWVLRDDRLVVGFALDHLLKGGAGQAVQNLNIVLGLPEMTGLLPPTQAGVIADTAPVSAS